MSHVKVVCKSKFYHLYEKGPIKVFMIKVLQQVAAPGSFAICIYILWFQLHICTLCFTLIFILSNILAGLLFWFTVAINLIWLKVVGKNVLFIVSFHSMIVLLQVWLLCLKHINYLLLEIEIYVVHLLYLSTHHLRILSTRIEYLVCVGPNLISLVQSLYCIVELQLITETSCSSLKLHVEKVSTVHLMRGYSMLGTQISNPYISEGSPLPNC